MGMVRCNVPSVFVYGGSALPGRWRGRDLTILDSYEAVGAVLAGTMQAHELDEIERACLPSAGACGGQFTANTMAMVSEALGLALPGSAMLPAVYAQRRAVEAYMGRAGRTFRRPIVTQVVPLERFWPAEEYHQDYMERNPLQPYIVLHDAPKVRRLRTAFPRLYRD